MRPLGWTSGDAAGLPILPGLVRYDEVLAGEIDHVIRFTAPKTANAYVWPASHKAATGGASDPPMGAWLRLKANYDISSFSAQNQVILKALKKHGLVLADNGSPFYMSGVPDPGWNNSDLNKLKTIPGSAFEAVDVSSIKISNTSYAVAGDPATATATAASAATATATATASASTTATATASSIANPGFETSLGGWNKGTSFMTLVRTCSFAHGGSCSAELGRTGPGRRDPRRFAQHGRGDSRRSHLHRIGLGARTCRALDQAAATGVQRWTGLAVQDGHARRQRCAGARSS